MGPADTGLPDYFMCIIYDRNTKRLQEDIIYIDKKGRIKWQLTQSKMKSYQ